MEDMKPDARALPAGPLAAGVLPWLGHLGTDRAARPIAADARGGRRPADAPRALVDTATPPVARPTARPGAPHATDPPATAPVRTDPRLRADSPELDAPGATRPDGARTRPSQPHDTGAPTPGGGDGGPPGGDAPGDDGPGAETAAVRPAAGSAADPAADAVEILSHELRSPLTAIGLGTSVLRRRRRQSDAPIREAVVEALDVEARRLARLVEDLLAVARHEHGARSLPVQPVLLQRVVPPQVEREAALHPGCRVDVSLPTSLPPAAADEEALGHVIRNVVRNAALYGGDAAPIEVTAELADDELEVSVRDRGPGVDPDELERIFEPFYQSRVVGGGGAGLGLPAARHLLAAMGGRIHARRREGGGVEIRIQLPVAQA